MTWKQENAVIDATIDGLDNGKSWPQIVAILIVCLGCLTSGIFFAWSSPSAIAIVEDKTNYDLTEEDVSLFMLYHPLGMLIMSLIFYNLSEKLGRKKSVLFLTIPQTLCWILTIFATTKWDFYIARMIAGAGDTIVFSTVPSYVGEIVTPTVRDYFGNLPTFSMYLGQVLITVVGSYFDVRTSAYICISFPVIFAILTCFLPESPYQLIKDGKMEEAKKSIQWFQRKRNVETEFLKTKADVERQISESGTWKNVFTITSNRRALRAGVFLRLSQQFCGVSLFATYAQTVFQKAGGNLSPQLSSIIYISILCGLNLICSVTVAKFGRRSPYFYSLLSCASVLLCLTTYFFLDQYNLVNLEKFNWFPLFGMLAYVVTYSFGLGIVPTLMLGELFSSSVKDKGLGILIGVFALGILVTTNIFHILTRYVGLYSGYLLYCISCFISTFLTLRWVPETKGKTLEEIQQELKK